MGRLKFHHLVLAVVMVAGFDTWSAWARHFHYISITDTRYPENDEDDPAYDEDWVLFDSIGEETVEERIVYTGQDDDLTISEQGQRYLDATGDAAAHSIFDFPGFSDIDNSQATMLIDLEVTALDSAPGKTIEIGYTDLVNRIRWEESEQTLSTNVLPSSDDVLGIPRWDALGPYPLRIKTYYHYVDFVLTFAVENALGVTHSYSFQGSAQPFYHFFPDGVPGTHPDNLSIYFYVLCESMCEVRVHDWKILNCDTSGGAIDVDACLLIPGVGNGQLDPGETCDDGNTTPGDGCDENGQLEKVGRKCQEAIGKAGGTYTKGRLKSLQKCRNKLNNGKALFADQAKTVAITDRSQCSNELKTAAKLAKAGEKAQRLIADKCTDALVGALTSCGETVAELVSANGTTGCLLEEHDAAVDALLTTQYGG